MTEITTFLAGSSILAVLIMQWLKKYIKGFIVPRFGDLGTQLVLLAVAVLLALAGYYWQKLPSDLVATTTAIFTSALVIYQVFVKAIWNKALRGKLDTDEK